MQNADTVICNGKKLKRWWLVYFCIFWLYGTLPKITNATMFFITKFNNSFIILCFLLSKNESFKSFKKYI